MTNEIIVQQGRLGLNSPKIATKMVVVVEHGVRSRTGRAMGNVDQGFCVDVTAYGVLGSRSGVREVIASERLYAPDRWDPGARNKIGGAGAYCNQKPEQAEVDASVQRLTSALCKDERSHLRILCVAAEKIGEQL